MPSNMTCDQREAFLADVHVAVLAVESDEEAPLAVPIWYDYEPGGDLRIHTGRTSTKLALIVSAGRFTITAQEETLPYRYVSVSGPVVDVTAGASPEERRRMAHRYLGPKIGDRYLQDTEATAEDTMVVTMRPQRWRTIDYGPPE